MHAQPPLPPPLILPPSLPRHPRQHWDEISAWFASMFPPTEEGSGEGSGEWGSGEWGSGYNATRPSSDRGGGGPVWEWRWPWS